ncbi:MAG: hypothetical protein FWE95_11580, partial [Planctomycetaceae bacterium]|nr:hypothetical protein [Planctomycetaceae bacterium]
DAERRQGRANFVRNLSWNPSEAVYPMFREVMLDAVEAREPETPSGPAGGPLYVQVAPSGISPFAVSSWSTDRVSSVVNAFFDLVVKKDELEEMREEIQKVVEEHEAMDAAKRDRLQYQNARLALAVAEIRLKNADAAVELIDAVVKENTATQRVIRSGGEYHMVLALELATLEESPAAINMAIHLLEETLKGNQSSGMESYILSPLMKLYLKSDRADEGREMALKQLREAFHYLKLMGASQQYQVGNRYYDSYSLQQSAVTMSRLLLDADNAFDLMVVFREMYDGQAWVRAARQQSNYRFQELDRISQELEGKISPKDFTEKLERLIPGMSEGGEVTPSIVPKLMLGQYITPYRLAPQEQTRTPIAAGALRVLEQMGVVPRTNASAPSDSNESLSGIRLADSLAVIAKEEPDRYAAIKTAIEELEKVAPEEPTVLIALTSVRLIDGDHAAVESLLRRCAEWSRDKATGEIEQQIYLGFWSLLKGTFADTTLMAKAEVRTDAETLFQFVGRLVGQITGDATEERRAQLTGFSSPVQSFLLDVQRHAPDELYQKFRPDVDAKVFEKILMPIPGYLTGDLATQRNRIAGQLSEGLTLAPSSVMQVFRTVFANNRYPTLQGQGDLSRENSMHLLFVFGKVLEAAREAEVEPDIVYEALLEIVLPENSGRKPFLAEYNDLGGENGYFRTPAADLVDWAVAANRVDELKERIAAKRSQNADWGVQLDAVDLLLALKIGDTERSTDLIEEFIIGVLTDNPQMSMYAAMAAVPAAKPFEFAEITEYYPALIELIDELIVSDSEDVKNARGRRYAYYMVRSFYERFAEEATLPQRIRWIWHYRGVVRLDWMCGFLYASEDKLFHDGLAAIADDQLADAVAVLRYFSSHNVNHFRYRDLTEFIAQLEPKLAALDEATRRELLGGLNLAGIAKQSTVKREPGSTTRLPVKQFDDLPPLPEGTVVYQNDFEKETGSEWSHDRRDTIPKIDNIFYGEFASEKVHFRLTDLPEHRFVRIRFDLLLFCGIDGLVGYPREFGPDIWGFE